MLPEDSKARHAQILEENLRQTNVNDHFKPAPKEEKPEPFSDELFKQAAIEWLVETNQVRTGNINELDKLDSFFFHIQCSQFRHLIMRLSRRWSTLPLV